MTSFQEKTPNTSTRSPDVLRERERVRIKKVQSWSRTPPLLLGRLTRSRKNFSREVQVFLKSPESSFFKLCNGILAVIGSISFQVS